MFVEKRPDNANVISAAVANGRKEQVRGFFDSSQRVEQLVDLYNKGWGCRRIAIEMGTTKNTVLGKLSRMRAAGLLGEQPLPMSRVDWTPEMIGRLRDVHGAGATRKEAAAALDCLESQIIAISRRVKLIWGRWRKTPAYRQPPPKRRKLIAVVNPIGVPLVDAKPDQCRWPVDTEPGTYHCCGHAVFTLPDGRRKSYCEYHCSVSYRRTDETE